MSRIYVATSWRNGYHTTVVDMLRLKGHEVYDFKNPPHGLGGFHWSELDPAWKSWNAREYRHALLSSPVAAQGYLSDLRGMQWADTCLLVHPCGRSAHLEFGWMIGRGKRGIILLENGEPELMAMMADDICCDLQEVLNVLGTPLGGGLEK